MYLRFICFRTLITKSVSGDQEQWAVITRFFTSFLHIYIEKAIIEYEHMSNGHIVHEKYCHFPTNALSQTEAKQLHYLGQKLAIQIQLTYAKRQYIIKIMRRSCEIQNQSCVQGLREEKFTDTRNSKTHRYQEFKNFHILLVYLSFPVSFFPLYMCSILFLCFPWFL